MSYRLGIDFGTTYTAAAVVEDGQASIVGLGYRAPVVPTVVFLKDDDTVLTGDAANRRALTEPDRVAREFKRRLGDPTPLLLGGTPMSAQSLVARMLRWTVDHVVEAHGGPPEHIALSHPANWGPYKLDLFDQAIRMADLGPCTLLTEPEAAAIYYASTQRIDADDIVAVYDLGGGTFDAAVLRKTASGFEILGTPEGIEHLGGIDIDEAVFARVVQELGAPVDDLDPDDPSVVASIARLRSDCVDAKEALSVDDECSIPVLLPGIQTEVTVTRGDFEAMIRPWLVDTIGALRRALASAQVEPDDVRAVLLVGGSSRIPLVARLVSEGLGRPVAVDAHPKHAVALGAALAANRAMAARDGMTPGPVVVATPPPTPGPGEIEPVGVGLSPEGAGSGRPTVLPDAATQPAASPPAPATVSPQLDVPEPQTAAAAASLAAPPSDAPAPATVSAPLALAPADVMASTPDSDSAPIEPDVSPARAATPVGDGARRNGSRLMVFSGAAGAVLLLLVVALVLFSGGDSEPAAGESPTEPTVDDRQPSAGSDAGVASGLRVTIDSIEVDGEDYVVSYTPHGFEPEIAGGGSHHLHFFFDTVDPENAGENGSEPGIWWDVPSDSAGPIPNDRPEGAEKMCVIVADHRHHVEPGTEHCAPLPE